MTKTREFDPTTLNTAGHILWFDDLGTGNAEYRFLSNFYEGDPITLRGVTMGSGADSTPVEFKTGEHAFAAMKFWGTDWQHFEAIVNAEDPNSAKALGRSRAHPLREDWEVVKLDVMMGITRAKYAQGREEADRLLDTGDALLVEGTYWYDEVWGVDLNHPSMQGRNWLGTLLMARRAELRAWAAYGSTGHSTADGGTQLRVDYFTGPTGTGHQNIRFAL